jgi:membrane-associated phospholipid phosphatase
VSRTTSPEARRAPGGVPPALVEGMGLVAAYLVFTWIQGQLGSDVVRAHANATTLQRLEGAGAGALEQGANVWTAGVSWLGSASALVYSLLLVAPPVVLGWLWLRHRADYPRLRTSLVVLTVASLPFFALFPVAPPRLHVPGTVDLVAMHRLLGSTTSPGSPHAGNLYAAMPSLHVAWAVWCAYAIWFCVRRQNVLAAQLASVVPVVAAADVVVTGNHYFVDVAAGVLLATCAITVVSLSQAYRLGWREGAGGDADRLRGGERLGTPHGASAREASSGSLDEAG